MEKKKTFITELFRHLWQQLLDLPYFPALTDTGLGDGRLNGSMNSGKIGGVHPIFDMFRIHYHYSMLYIVQSKRHFRESIYALQAWRLGFVSANQSWRLQYTSLTYRIIRYLYKSIQVLQVFSKWRKSKASKAKFDAEFSDHCGCFAAWSPIQHQNAKAKKTSQTCNVSWQLLEETSNSVLVEVGSWPTVPR